jgi:alpha-tubulin suppressor-like RCC1 family protein
MNRIALTALAFLAVALPSTFSSDADAQTCPFTTIVGNAAWAWGLNSDGQLGDGQFGDGTTITAPVLTPVRVQLSGVVAVSAGTFFSLALKNDCTVWGWGDNSNGQLGNNQFLAPQILPVQTLNLTGIIAIAAGSSHSLALKNDGTVWAWGANDSGQLGDGTTMERHIPVQVQNLSGIVAIASGIADFSLALKNDGTVWAWGPNFAGNLGVGDLECIPNCSTPVRVHGLTEVQYIAKGFVHSLAVKGDGTVWAWGGNANGELGDGTTIERHTPVQVVVPWVVYNLGGRIIAGPGDLTNVKAVAAGEQFSLALKNDGTVVSWGLNSSGQLGDGNVSNRNNPWGPVSGVSGATAIAAGDAHSLAASNAASLVQTWGANGDGQLGNGTTLNSSVPTMVPILADNLISVSGVAGGLGHSLAVGPAYTLLTLRKILMHPNNHQFRQFNLIVDGNVVKQNINSGSITVRVAPGNHTVSETGGTNTSLAAFTTVIGGDCAANGAISLAPGDNKTCTITNFDHYGTCGTGLFCCDPGDDTHQCKLCRTICQ